MGIKILVVLISILCCVYGSHAAIFTIHNNCPYTIWPATLTGTGSQVLTGFKLASQASKTLNVPAPWSGRLWARFACSNSGGRFSCFDGDCGSGQIECHGAGGNPPASLVEFTLGGADNKDFFDVSLVDGFNLPVAVTPKGTGATCSKTSCPVDINRGCPNELAVRDGNDRIVGCKSACLVFNQPQFCCTGDYGTPTTCKPTNYSEMFKRQCPQAYSYAYDDKTSTFTCPTLADYLVTFCP